MSEPLARWKGRNSEKDQLRYEVWSNLEQSGAAIGSPWSCIPNFVGAQEAAEQLCSIQEWKIANVVKTNPDSAQAWVRLNALEQGKMVYTPIPELVEDFPFLLLDPDKLLREGIPFTEVMYSEGALKHGQKVEFRDMKPLDIVVVGCVAVTAAGGRTGKGAGFADLELGVFRHFGIVQPETPVLTTVHDLQLVDSDAVVMLDHDTPLDWIATPSGLFKTDTAYSRPGPLEWDKLQADQYESIPFLKALRDDLCPRLDE